MPKRCLLICDEPTSALDPMGRKEILDILSSLKKKTTVIFSTHILSDVERICDSIGILNNGIIQTSGSIEEIKRKYGKPGISISFSTEQQTSHVIKKISNLLPNVAINKKNKDVFFTNDSQTIDLGNQLLTILSNEKIVPLEFKQSETSLESIFLEVVK